MNLAEVAIIHEVGTHEESAGSIQVYDQVQKKNSRSHRNAHTPDEDEQQTFGRKITLYRGHTEGVQAKKYQGRMKTDPFESHKKEVFARKWYVGSNAIAFLSST